MVNRKPGFIGFVIAAVVILALFAGSFNPALATIVRTLAINQSYVIVNLDALDQAATHYFYKPTTGWSALRYHKDLGYFELSTDEGSTWNRVTTVDIDTDTTDHTLLSNIGSNTHPTVDTHLASTADPHSTVSDTHPPTLTEAFSGAHTFDYLEHFNGTILETIDVDITESGGTVSLELQADGGGDLTINFSDGPHAFDATDPVASVALTAGTDTAPVKNWVYILQSNDTLTASTVGWPDAEHAPIATVVIQTAATVASSGPLAVHARTDHIKDGNDQGHLNHITDWIRGQHATWKSGIAPTLTITEIGGSDTVIFTSTSGEVDQLHPHDFPAFTGTPDIRVFNEPGAAYNVITDINQLTQDSEGNAFTNNTYFTVTVWGIVSEKSVDCKLYLNLPSGTYGNSTSALLDSSNFTNTSIPAIYKGGAFLIVRYTLLYQTVDSGTFSLVADGDVDLRGQPPGTLTGGGAGGGSSLTVEEQDSSPSIPDVNTMKFPNGTISDEGGGIVSVDAGGGSPGGADTNVQYNNGGTFGGDADLVYDDATKELWAKGRVKTSAIYLWDSTDDKYIELVADDFMGTNLFWRFPVDNGVSGEYLRNQGGGQTHWSDGQSPSGSNFYIQYYSSGNLGATSIFRWENPYVVVGNNDNANRGFKGTSYLIGDLSSNYVELESPSLADDWTFTFPVDGGTDGMSLHTDGNGVTTWETGAGAGDMLKSVYDTNDDEIIDLAASHADLARATGDTYTGTHDAGGATLELPNAAGDGTLGNAGEVHVDLAEDALAMHFGAAGAIAGEAQITALVTIDVPMDPGTQYVIDTDARLIELGLEVPNGFKIIRWSVDFGMDPDVELDADLCYADDWAETNEVVIDVLDTTNGTSSETNPANINGGVAIATGKRLYIRMNADPEGTGDQMSFRMQGYAEED